ncbi:AAA family ATPase [Tabrizicola sp. M-4]|uniref:AAA family ATPase n=1 Tax=Tabrizicola sp. M-4 TaxID=3055847 RepID=UPI003DA7CFE5
MTRKASRRTGKKATGRRSKTNTSDNQAFAPINRIAAATASTSAMLRKRYKPLDFVLPGLLLRTVSLLLGPGGVGKSNFALQNAISIAIGRDIFNLWGEPDNSYRIKKGKVIYISAEDGEDVLAERLQNACKHLSPWFRKNVEANIEFIFPDSFSIVMRQDGRLAESDWIRDLHIVLAAADQKPRLIIVDTLNRSLGDANENSATGMAKIKETLKRIAETHNCGVQIVHHTVKNAGDAEAGLKLDVARGSSAAVCSVRSMINLAPDDINPNVVWYALTKSNYSPKPPTRFAIRNEDGVLFGSAQHPDRVSSAKPAQKAQQSDQSGAPSAGKKAGKAAKAGKRGKSAAPALPREPKVLPRARLN